MDEGDGIEIDEKAAGARTIINLTFVVAKNFADSSLRGYDWNPGTYIIKSA